MQNYRKLLVWEKAHAVAVGVHRATERWPRRSNQSLIGQLRRSSLSVPANIAEGCAKASDREFARFVQIAIGSTVETEYHLQFAADVGLLAPREYESIRERVSQVRRMLVGLSKRLRTNPPRGPNADSR